MAKDTGKTAEAPVKAKDVKVIPTRLGGSWTQKDDGSLVPNDAFTRGVEAKAKAKAARLKKQNETKED